MSRRAGLGLAQGFMQGFDFMDRIDKRERRMGLAEASNSRAEDAHRWRGEQMEHQREEWQRAEDGRLVQAMHEGVQSGRIDPNLAGEFGRRFDVDWSNYVNEDFGQSLNVLEGTINGDYSMRSPEFRSAFETVFRTEINKGSGEEYQGADGAHRIEQKRLAGVYPGPDGQTLMVDLEVLDRGPNGEQWRRAPVTTNRSALDDEVRAIPLEAALKKLKGHQLMYNAVQESPELQAVIRQYAARTGVELSEPERSNAYLQRQELIETGLSPEQARDQAYGIKPPERYGQPFEHPQLGWVQPGPNGQLHQLDRPGSNSRSPADVQTAEWMVQNGIAPTLDVAWNRINESRTDPARFVSDFVTQELKAQEAAGVYPEDEGFRTTEQLRNQAIEALQTIRAKTRGTEQHGSGGDPAGLEVVGTESQVLPADGSSVEQPDGSYSGRVNRSPAPGPTKQAPPEAIAHLQNNPHLADQFQAKYGYLPEGFNG